MSTTTLQLDHFVDPFEARVVYQRDASGTIIDARFDLSGLPRLDPLLIGKEVVTVPDVVKRLCGICPVTHHLAGVRALDMLYGATVPETARLVRTLLADGAILDATAPKLFASHRELATLLKKVGKQVMAAAGCPGHFPDVAIPGGVRAPGNPSLVTDLPALIDALASLPLDEDWTDTFTGLSVALVNNGALHSLGDSVALSDGRVLSPAEFASAVMETKPGEPAPQPTVDGQLYRVGPMAQSVVAGRAAGPQGALKEMLLAVTTRITEVLADPALVEGTLVGEGTLTAGEGIGLAEGPRGLLMHRYVADSEGTLTHCQILTPTAQNEPWLAQMLAESLNAGATLENSIRTADPCLPITSAPAGAMSIDVAEVD
ncbi:nickel-dependent hydrogenase large subunit [Corynebacterium sp. H130]|uniref:nickel-dependent hydrogenase large subunit n=1 Tax=Corynebacterium sp. H130 TaxID=3133444 RepID=UPI0030B17C6B